MSNNIGWCDVTINPVVGCTKCSPGCENCYAEKFAYRMSRNPQTWQKYAGVVDANGKWTGKVNVTLDAKTMPHRVPGKNKRVFVGSMSDLFHPNVSDATRDVIFASILGDHIIGNGHGHTYMILTKRAAKMCDYFSFTPPDELLRRWGEAGDGWLTLEGDTSFSEHLESHLSYYGWETFWPLPNLWAGITVCNQEEADSKIPLLLATPAAKRFVSIEPMLDAIDIGKWVPGSYECTSCLSRFPATYTPELRCHECGFSGPDTDEIWGDDGESAQCPKCGAWESQGAISYECPECGGVLMDDHPDTPYLDWTICGGESGSGARPMHPDWVRLLRDQCANAGVPFYFKGWGGTKKVPPLLDGREWHQFPKQ